MGNKHSRFHKKKKKTNATVQDSGTSIENKMVFMCKKIALSIPNSLSLINGYLFDIFKTKKQQKKQPQIPEHILEIILVYIFEIDTSKAVLISINNNTFQYEYISKGDKNETVTYKPKQAITRDSITNKLQIRHKILILGAAQSGKSTILRQFRFLYQSKFEQKELLAAKTQINMNLIEAMRTLAIYSEIFKNQNQNKNTKVAAQYEKIREETSLMSDKEKFTEKHYKSFMKLYNDKGIKNTLNNYCSLFQIIDTYKYLFDNMHKYCNDEYIPTMDDLLHHYKRTNGVNKIEFEEYSTDEFTEIFDIFDVGGFRTERLKWKQFYENSEIIINVINLNGYYRSIWEDNRVNRLTEDIELFGYLVNCQYLTDSHFIVFLNKFDLFVDNIKHNNIKNYHLDFEGDEKNVNQVIEYIINKLLQQVIVNDDNKMRNIHFIATSAVSSECIKDAFEYIRNDVIYLSKI